jgi:hypothetical protein
MGGVASISGPDFRIVCFTEPDGATPEWRVAAVAVWRDRSLSATSHPPWRALIEALRQILRPPPRPAAPEFRSRWRSPDGWSGASDERGREVLYSRERGVVRIREQDYPLRADGRTLVLLVEEVAGVPAKVKVHAAGLPPWPAEETGTLRLLAGVLRARSGGPSTTHPWVEHLRSDPVVRSFLARSDADGIT